MQHRILKWDQVLKSIVKDKDSDLSLACVEFINVFCCKAFFINGRREIHIVRQDPVSHLCLADRYASVRSGLRTHDSHVVQRSNDVFRQHPAAIGYLLETDGGLIPHLQNRCRKSCLPESCVPNSAQLAQRLFRSANPSLELAQLVAYAHQDLPKAFPLPRGEHEDAGEVIVVPADFLFAEEPCDPRLWTSRVIDGNILHEQIVVEGSDVEENRFVVQEEFGKEGEVLAEQLRTSLDRLCSEWRERAAGIQTDLMFFSIDLVDGVAVSSVYQPTESSYIAIRTQVLARSQAGEGT